MNEVESFYDREAEEEWNRLERHRIEYAVTRHYIDMYCGQLHRILDIGGGPGRYSIYLARQGKRVTIVDLSSASLRLAKMKADESGVQLDNYIHSNVLDLNVGSSERFDAVLCMGPLYHLLDEDDRIAAVQGCLGHLRSGGIFFASFISAYAPLIDTLKKQPDRICSDGNVMLRYLADGRNRVGPLNPGFTDAFFIHPRDIRPFLSQFPLEEMVLTGLEGIPAQSEAVINALNDEAFSAWVSMVIETSKDEMTWASCEHLLYVGRKR